MYSIIKERVETRGLNTIDSMKLMAALLYLTINENVLKYNSESSNLM